MNKYRNRWNIIIPVMVGILFLGLLIIALINWYYGSAQVLGTSIAADVELLEKTFNKIHNDATILSFDYQKNPINYLNVVSFVSSELGPVNFTNPQGWKGPYLKDNPNVQGIEYQVVRTYQGYFITPGEGVRLPNGKVIGKDIMLDEKADIEKMMLDPQQLRFQDKPLAQKLVLPSPSRPLLEILTGE